MVHLTRKVSRAEDTSDRNGRHGRYPVKMIIHYITAFYRTGRLYGSQDEKVGRTIFCRRHP